jgi:hypothetical protein
MMRSTWRRPFFGRTQSSSPVGEKQEADLIAGLERGHGEAGGGLGGALAQGEVAGAEGRGAGDIEREDHGQLALLPVQADERFTRAGRHVPVHHPDVVARRVFP